MSQPQSDSNFKGWNSDRRALVITSDAQWTVPLLRADFDDLTILEWSEKDLHSGTLAPDFELVVLQPGAVSAADLNRWLLLGLDALGGSGSLALDLRSTVVTASSGGVDDLAWDDAMPGWGVSCVELIGELPVLLLRPASDSDTTRVREQDLSRILAACQAVREAGEGPLRRETQNQSRTVVATAEKRALVEERADQAEKQRLSAERRANNQSRQRKLAEARVRALESSRWFALAQRYRRLLGRRDEKSAKAGPRANHRVRSIAAALLAMLILLGIYALWGWVAAAIFTVIGLQSLSLLQTRRYERRSASQDHSSGRRLVSQQQRLNDVSKHTKSIQRSQRSMAKDLAKSVERLGLLRADQRHHALVEEEQVESLKQATRSELHDQYEQIHSTINLFALTHATAPTPPLRGTELSPDALMIVAAHVLTDHPRLILELSGGSSAVWLALTIRRHGLDARIVSLECTSEIRDRVRDLAVAHGVADLVDVRLAPLVDVRTGSRCQPWYDPRSVQDLSGIEMVVVDGPPVRTHDQARYPALPLLWEHMAPGAMLLLDDAGRADEIFIRVQWLKEHAGLSEEYVQTENGLSVIRLPTTVA